MNQQQFGLGLVAIVLSGLTACNSINPQSVSNQNPNGTNPAAKSESKITAYLERFELLEGTNFLLAPVYLVPQGRGGILSLGRDTSYTKEGYLPCNYFFFDRDTLSTTKLFSNHQSLVVNLEKIGESSNVKIGETNQTVMKKVTHLWYQIVKADTNGNKTLDAGDRATIAISDPAGKNYQELVKDIDRLLNVHVKNKDVRILFYQAGNKYFATEINLVNRQVKTQELPSLEG